MSIDPLTTPLRRTQTGNRSFRWSIGDTRSWTHTDDYVEVQAVAGLRPSITCRFNGQTTRWLRLEYRFTSDVSTQRVVRDAREWLSRLHFQGHTALALEKSA